jgi:hypothetical protein
MAVIKRLREKGKIVFRSEHRNIYQKLVEILESDYMDELSEIRFKITHLPGMKNHLPDALSRFYDNNDREEVTSEGIFLAGVIEDLRIQTEDLEEVPIIDSEEKKRTVMHRAHLAGYMATSIRALARVRWANMMKDCQAFVSACL